MHTGTHSATGNSHTDWLQQVAPTRAEFFAYPVHHGLNGLYGEIRLADKLLEQSGKKSGT